MNILILYGANMPHFRLGARRNQMSEAWVEYIGVDHAWISMIWHGGQNAVMLLIHQPAEGPRETRRYLRRTIAQKRHKHSAKPRPAAAGRGLSGRQSPLVRRARDQIRL